MFYVAKKKPLEYNPTTGAGRSEYDQAKQRQKHPFTTISSQLCQISPFNQNTAIQPPTDIKSKLDVLYDLFAVRPYFSRQPPSIAKSTARLIAVLSLILIWPIIFIMSASVCPYLGLLDDPDAHLNYPSFENRCYATIARESIPLSEQSVFCLGGQYKSCPRYMALHGPPQPEPNTVEAGPMPPPASAANMQQSSAPVPVYAPYPIQPPARQGKDWSMAMIIGGTLLTILLCTGAAAGYFSMKALFKTVLSPTPTVAVAEGSATPPVAMPPAGGSITPTPLITGSPIPTETPTSSEAPPGEQTPTPTFTPVATQPTVTPGGSPTPRPTFTRRPPPTMTPRPTATRSATAIYTPTPPAVTISFTATKTSIFEGDCTTLKWNVINARAVYLDNVGVPGVSSKKVCPLKNTTYRLKVIDLRNNTSTKSLTILVKKGTPSATPTYTVTWTPWPTRTPTITPTPTLTPTPTPFFAQWEAQPPSYSGSALNVNITFINHGSGLDALRVTLGSTQLPPNWSVSLCDSNGCAASKITPDVPAGGNTSLVVRFSVPDGATGTGVVYLKCVSVRDPGVEISPPVSIILRLP